MTTNDSCYLLAMDFDESTWNDDVKVIVKICKENNIPVYAERSRSGNGCHLWFFFENEIKASLARRFGIVILDLAMQKCENIKFDSYDRLFPSQDFLQKGGFGNLIALPLQKEARKQGNSVFVDENLNEIEDQWRYLAQITKISEEFVTKFCKDHVLKDLNADLEQIGNKEEKVSIDQNDFPEILMLDRGSGIHISKSRLSSKGIFSLSFNMYLIPSSPFTFPIS
jgi:hypothetical protein